MIDVMEWITGYLYNTYNQQPKWDGFTIEEVEEQLEYIKVNLQELSGEYKLKFLIILSDFIRNVNNDNFEKDDIQFIVDTLYQEMGYWDKVKLSEIEGLYDIVDLYPIIMDSGLEQKANDIKNEITIRKLP